MITVILGSSSGLASLDLGFQALEDFLALGRLTASVYS